MWQPPISTSTSPFQVYPPFLAKKFIPPPTPSDSIFGKSYPPPTFNNWGVPAIFTITQFTVSIKVERFKNMGF